MVQLWNINEIDNWVLLTQVRWQRTFRWYNLYSLNFRRPNKTDNPFLAFWNNHWLLIGDIVWFHMNHKCQLRCIFPTLLHILISRFSHHSLRQTKQHFLSCWLQSFVWVEAAAGSRYSIAIFHTEQLKFKYYKIITYDNDIYNI